MEAEEQSGIFGEAQEVADALPNELKGIISFEGHGIRFGKVTSFKSAKEFFQAINQLAKRIRPSRGNLTASEFRQLVETWRQNMIKGAKDRNNIDLDI